MIEIKYLMTYESFETEIIINRGTTQHAMPVEILSAAAQL